MDIDAGATEIAKLRLWLSLVVEEEDISQIKPLPNLDYKIVCGNSLLGYPYVPQGLGIIEKLKDDFFIETRPNKKTELRNDINHTILGLYENTENSLGYKVTIDFKINFSEVFKNNGGFDVVIANPPYITLALGKKQNIFSKKEIELLTSLYKDVMEYKGNTFVLFLKRAYEILAEKKICTFIIPNTMLLNNTCQKIRKYLLEKTSLRILLNIKDKVFESAEIGGNLIFLFKKSSNDENKVQISDINDINEFNAIETQLILQKKYQSNEGYKLYTDIVSTDLVNKIRNNSIFLEEVASFYNGIKTGNNKKFLTDKKINYKYKEVLRGRDIYKYKILFNNCYVLFDKELLWSNTDETKLEKKPKIIIRQTGDSLIAALDEVGYLSMDTTHIIYDSKINIFFLLAVINSKLMKLGTSKINRPR